MHDQEKSQVFKLVPTNVIKTPTTDSTFTVLPYSLRNLNLYTFSCGRMYLILGKA